MKFTVGTAMGWLATPAIALLAFLRTQEITRHVVVTSDPEQRQSTPAPWTRPEAWPHVTDGRAKPEQNARHERKVAGHWKRDLIIDLNRSTTTTLIYRTARCLPAQK